MLNPTEAPEGLIAEPFMGCQHCILGDNSNKCNTADCFASERKDKTMVQFKLKHPQPDLLNAATHEQRKQTVTISAELSDAYVTLLRAAEKMSEISHDEEDSTFGNAYDDVIEAMEQVLRAGGGKT